jgi:hypothetical protein
LENRQSCGEIVRYRVSPHIKSVLFEVKKDDEKLVVPDKTKAKEGAKELGTNKKESEEKLTSLDGSGGDGGEKEEEARRTEEEMKQAEFMRNLERIRMDNLNMVCYGIPDVYLTN